MFQAIKYFIGDYYGVIVVWAAITLMSVFAVNGCNKREIRRLESIVEISRVTHEKEVKILKESHEKQIKDLKAITEKYDKEMKKITEQYKKNLNELEKQQKIVYEGYLQNQELMSKALVKYFGLKDLGGQ
jgi:phosphoenolpyruvate carboxylase